MERGLWEWDADCDTNSGFGVLSVAGGGEGALGRLSMEVGVVNDRID